MTWPDSPHRRLNAWGGIRDGKSETAPPGMLPSGGVLTDIAPLAPGGAPHGDAMLTSPGSVAWREELSLPDITAFGSASGGG